MRNAPDIHAVYGYMQVGEIIREKDLLPDWLGEHPHYSYNIAWEQRKNAIFLPSNKLSLNESFPGAGTLDYSPMRVLTKVGMSRRFWGLPDFFKGLKITCNPNPWVDGVFRSARIGQEFVFDAISDALTWAEHIISTRE